MAASDEWLSTPKGLDSPADRAIAITPSDTADLAALPRALYIGTGGAVKITTKGGDTVTLANVPAGTVLPVRAARVWSTGTTASDIVALR